MSSFRNLFNDELKKTTPLWMEMGIGTTPKVENKGWMAQLSPAARNLLSMAPKTKEDDKDKNNRGLKQGKDVVNQAKIAYWLFHDGLYEASQERAKFTKRVNEQLPPEQQVHEVYVFAEQAHKKFPALAKLWNESMKQEWFSNHEPKMLESMGLIMDLQKVNEIIREFGGEEFYFGGLNGFMPWLESAQWEGAPKMSFKEPFDQQGPDLSQGKLHIDDDSGQSFYEFKGLQAPNEIVYFQNPIKNALVKMDRAMESDEGKAFTEFQKSLKTSKIKSRDYSYGSQYDADNKFSGKDGMLPVDDNGYDDKVYEHIKKMVAYGLKLPYVSKQSIDFFPPENRAFMKGNKTFYYLSPEQQKEAYENFISGASMNNKVMARINNPVTGARWHIAGIINTAAKKLKLPATKLTLYRPEGIDYSQFAYVEKQDEVDEKGSTLYHITQALGDGWNWDLTDEEKSEGREIPSSKRRQATIRLGSKRSGSKKYTFKKNNETGLFHLVKPTKEPCGPEGCGLIGVDFGINTNTQGKMRTVPLPTPEATEDALQDMVINPENWGEREGTSASNVMDLPAVKSAVRRGISAAKSRGVADPDEGNAFTAAVIWLQNNLGDGHIKIGNLNNTKFIEKLQELENVDYKKIDALFKSGKEPQSIDPSNEETYFPEDITKALLKNGKEWRIYQMSSFIARVATGEESLDDKMVQQSALADEDGKGIEAGDNQRVGATEREGKMAMTFTSNRARKFNAITGSKTGVTEVDPSTISFDKVMDMIRKRSEPFINITRLEKQGYSDDYANAFKNTISMLDANDLQSGPIRALKNAQNSSSEDEKLGIVDGVHDYFVELVNSVMRVPDPSEEVETMIFTLASVLRQTIPKLKALDSNGLIADSGIDQIADEVSKRTKTTNVPQQDIRQLPQQGDAAMFKAAMQDAIQAHQYGYGSMNDFLAQVYQNDNWSRMWQKVMQSDPELQHYQQQYQQQYQHQQQQQPQIRKVAESLIKVTKFSEWMDSLKETDAVYDGTPAKDGGGFNWWGAVGSPGGVSISGEADNAEEDPTGKGKKRGKRRTRKKK